MFRIFKWSKWECEKCHSELRFERHRRIATAFASMLLSSLVFTSAAACLLTGVPVWSWAPWLLIAYVGGGVLIMRHRDKVVLSETITSRDLEKIAQRSTR
jgi:hypothetical protein